MHEPIPGRSAFRRPPPFPLAPLIALGILLVPSAVGSLATGGLSGGSDPLPGDGRPPGQLAGGGRGADREPQAPAPTATELILRPSLFTGEELSLPLTFAAWSEGWNPFLTRFGPAEFRAFEAWTDEQFLWEPQALAAPALTLFVRRGSAAEWALEDARPHARYELSLAVRSAFAGRAWCEVLGVRPLEESVGEGALVHATRAIQAMRDRQWRRAEAELERALAAPLPDQPRAELERYLELCARALRPHGHDPDTLRPRAQR